jgi:ribonuclease T2
VDQRFSLALAAIVLLGGAVALWLSSGQQTATPVAAPANAPAPPAQSYTLAISWHPAFCETKPGLQECRGERASDYTADHFGLHGLWPEDEYCGVSDRLVSIDSSNRWSDLPAVDLSDATWRELARTMPGAQEQLERHEWISHGTCSGASADIYFSRAIALVEAVNASTVRDLFARNSGKHVSRNQIRAAFVAAFVDGAGR